MGIDVRLDGDLVRVRIDRPERDNGIDGSAIAELEDALAEAESRPEVRLVVLAGRPGTFCTGMDLTAAAGGGADAGGRAFYRLLDRFTTTPLVVVSQVDGRVAGGGIGLVAASDFTYATPRSTFGLPEALWGLLPCCVLPFLLRRVGFQAAYSMTLSTRPLDAASAASVRLVDGVADDPERPVRQLAHRLSRVDRSTVDDLKAYFRALGTLPADWGDIAVAEFGRLMTTPVVRDRLSRFAETGRFPWEAAG